MSGKEYFILGSTFFMGMFFGAFLYVTVYAPSYESNIPDQEAIDDDIIVIEGRMYGGCMRTDSCASFKLLSDRTYSYLEYGSAEVENGKLPSDLSDAVFDSIGTEQFFNDTEEILVDSCASYADSVDYAYEVTLDEDVYELDTCETALAHDLELKNTLLSVWMFMEDPTATYPTIIEEGVGQFFIDRFQEGG